ncbi:cation transporter [Listeria sp. FSL L7-1485]|uniref:Cation transporter n=1 Tax=Listeria immobilis TaxID=2713502 RepID=A0A7X0X9H2_9LIST|nr:cation diffusion facilitator family transporter [Listeria immobilis]MBC1490012.1 cation transporter [Listeria immobilis]MBC1516911.1 cation transporter [Listeria immobilis]MBC1537140.1 cation transporter [Listeria immobilis]
MAHNHDHAHGHNHNHAHNANKKALFTSFILIATFMVVEVIGGIMTNSLALLSDAGHMLSDAVALGLSLAAFKFGEKAANANKTYGYKRFEILAAFLNGLTLVGISVFIFYEAIGRFFNPPQVVGPGMMTIAVIGLLVNILVAWILMKGDTSGNLNMRSAFLHVLGDLLGSVGAIVAALLIIFLGWNIADPIASVIVAMLILISGWRVLKDAVHILMEGKPANVNMEEVKTFFENQDGVESVHDLHVWAITSDFNSLTAHLTVKEDADRDKILAEIEAYLRENYSLEHSTIQLEGSHTHHHHCN